jgi:hypothetical protein
MSFSNDFSQQLNLIMARPGFTRTNSTKVFTDTARTLLDRGVSEQETLAIMQDIYVAGTEYHGSYEAGIDVAHRVIKAGFEEEQAYDLTYEASSALAWVKPVVTVKEPSPLSKILKITISPVGSHT